MKIGIVITVYNRPEYFSKMLDSFKKSNFPSDVELFMVNDNSNDVVVNRLFNDFSLPDVKITKIKNDRNQNMFFGLKLGWDYFYNNEFDILANIDSDVIVKPYWVQILLQLYKLFPDRIISGFNTLHHPISETFPKYHTKASIGGVNFLFDRETYPSIKELIKDCQWDWSVCYFMQKTMKSFIVSNPSVIQHIGASSTLRSHTRNDVANDYVE